MQSTNIGTSVSRIEGPDEVTGEACFAFDPREAMQPDAPQLHDDVAAYEGAPIHVLGTDIHNGQTRLAWHKGDVAQGFRDADVILEHSSSLPSRHQGYIKPNASVISIDDDGRVQAWCSSKVRPVGNWPKRPVWRKIKSKSTSSQWGDFGGKGDARDLPIAYLLAKMADRPVKIVMSSMEEFTASNPTHPTFITIRSGVTRDGHLTARVVRTVHASGAYGAMKPRAYLSTHHYVGGGYHIPNTSLEFLQVYTNTAPGGYFQAPGAHQYTFALEPHTDLQARELGMGPAEFKRINLLNPGKEDALGRPLRLVNVRQVMDAALEVNLWGRPKSGPVHGRGVAIFGRQISGRIAGAVVTAEADETFSVISPTVDIGTGTQTIKQQIVASEMKIPLHQVRGRQGDIDSTPYDESPRASRVIYTEGQAIAKACKQAKQVIADGTIFPLTVTFEDVAPEPEDITYFSAQVAEVDVGTETGQVKVLRLVTAHDVGTVINPLAHQGQIEGGVVTGLGMGATEELVTYGGQVLNGNLGDYKLATVSDVPSLETVLIQTAGGTGPYESKTIGELANNATAAAIANPVADATGCQLFELRITAAERVYKALRSGRKA